MKHSIGIKAITILVLIFFSVSFSFGQQTDDRIAKACERINQQIQRNENESPGFIPEYLINMFNYESCEDLLAKNKKKRGLDPETIIGAINDLELSEGNPLVAYIVILPPVSNPNANIANEIMSCVDGIDMLLVVDLPYDVVNNFQTEQAFSVTTSSNLDFLADNLQSIVKDYISTNISNLQSELTDCISDIFYLFADGPKGENHGYLKSVDDLLTSICNETNVTFPFTGDFIEVDNPYSYYITQHPKSFRFHSSYHEIPVLFDYNGTLPFQVDHNTPEVSLSERLDVFGFFACIEVKLTDPSNPDNYIKFYVKEVSDVSALLIQMCSYNKFNEQNMTDIIIHEIINASQTCDNRRKLADLINMLWLDDMDHADLMNAGVKENIFKCLASVFDGKFSLPFYGDEKKALIRLLNTLQPINADRFLTSETVKTVIKGLINDPSISPSFHEMGTELANIYYKKLYYDLTGNGYFDGEYDNGKAKEIYNEIKNEIFGRLNSDQELGIAHNIPWYYGFQIIEVESDLKYWTCQEGMSAAIKNSTIDIYLSCFSVTFWYRSSESVQLNWDELINVYFPSGSETLSMIASKSPYTYNPKNKDYVNVLMPAWYLAWLIEQKTAKTNMEHAITGTELATLFMGAGEIAAAKSTIRLAIGITELVVASSDIIVNNTICDNPTTPARQEFCKTWQNVTLAVDLALLSSNLILDLDLCKKLKRTYEAADLPPGNIHENFYNEVVRAIGDGEDIIATVRDNKNLWRLIQNAGINEADLTPALAKFLDDAYKLFPNDIDFNSNIINKIKKWDLTTDQGQALLSSFKKSLLEPGLLDEIAANPQLIDIFTDAHRILPDDTKCIEFMKDLLVKGENLIGSNLDLLDEDMIKSWKILNEANTTLLRDISALKKMNFLKSKGLTDHQLKIIGELNDIKAFDIAESLAKRTNPIVPPQQIDLVAKNAKSLEGVRPNIMDEISDISGNDNLLNADGLNGFLDNAVKNPSQTGWKYELEVLKGRLNDGSEIQFSKQVLTKTGDTKEVDILDYTKSELIEIKSYSSSSWVTIAKKFGEDVGSQIGKIDNSVKSQFNELIGHVRIEPGGNSTWLNASKTELISNLKQARLQYDEIIEDMDNMTKLVIENATGTHTIERELWQ